MIQEENWDNWYRDVVRRDEERYWREWYDGVKESEEREKLKHLALTFL